MCCVYALFLVQTEYKYSIKYPCEDETVNWAGLRSL